MLSLSYYNYSSSSTFILALHINMILYLIEKCFITNLFQIRTFSFFTMNVFNRRSLPLFRSYRFLLLFIFLVALTIVRYIAIRMTTHFGLISVRNMMVELPSPHQSSHNSISLEGRLSAQSYHFYNHRLRLWNEGRCVDATDEGEIFVTFCDPDRKQSFSLTSDHRLVYERLGRCVKFVASEEWTVPVAVALVECSAVESHFTLDDDIGGSFLKQIVNDKELCLTPISLTNHSKPVRSPCLNDPVRLTKCDEVASRIVLMEEAFFQEDRKLLKGGVIQQGSLCDFKACSFNRREPVKTLPPDQVKQCTNLSDCVTFVTKTSKRPHFILRLAKSIRTNLGHDLPFVVYDDGPDDLSEETRHELAEYPLLKYIVSNNKDLGIAEGRDLAILQVRTKYLFLLDDDMIVTPQTNLQKLVGVLDETDTSVVSASCTNGCTFDSFLQFGYFHEKSSKRRLGQFKGACSLANQTIPGFPGCVRCDITSNIFLARTDHVLDIGGWDPELKIVEHRDFFIGLKAAGLKLVVCNGVTLYHARPREGSDEQGGEEYLEKRRRGGIRFKKLILNRWNLHAVFQQSFDTFTLNEAGDVEFLIKGDPGTC